MDDAPPRPETSLWRRALRAPGGVVGFIVIAVIAGACLLSLPWTLGQLSEGPAPYRAQRLAARHLPPFWASHDEGERARLLEAGREIAIERGVADPTEAEAASAAPRFLFGSDALGRDVLARCLLGGAVSIGIGLAAAGISVVIGALYGAMAGYAGGRIDNAMMRVVDVLYGLPYILLVVLLAVAVDALVRGRATGGGAHAAINVATLLVAIGAVSWLTLARVVRGQVLSLRGQPFVEAARAIGATPAAIFRRHLLPNLVGPITVYGALVAPQAILQESFLSFLGIGVQPPTPSWGGMVAEGLGELNPVEPRWWLLLFPSLLLGAALLALNFVGEALRAALDPRAGGR